MRTMTSKRRTTNALAGALAASALVLGGCGQDSAAPEEGEVTLEDLQEIEDRVGAVEEGLSAAEERIAEYGTTGSVGTAEGGGLEGGAVDGGIIEGVTEDVIGEEATVSGEVTEVVELVGPGAAFWFGGESGQRVPVFAAEPLETEVQPGDQVRVTGTVIGPVDPGVFEAEVGMAPDEFFADPDAFFEEDDLAAGLVADQVEQLQTAN